MPQGRHLEEESSGGRRRGLYRAEFPMPPGVDGDALSKLKMKSRYEMFDRSRLRVQPLAARTNDLQLERWLALDDETPAFSHAHLRVVARKLTEARQSGAARSLMMGAHGLR